MTDDFESELRETLGQVVPTPPEAPNRASGARGYARRLRRARAATAVGAVAVVAAAAIVVPSVLASPDSDVAGPGPKTPVTDTPPRGGPACPPASQADKATDVAAVPGNAVAARLCVLTTAGPVWSPREPLITGLEDLARTLNVLPPATPHGCIPEGSLPVYQLVFQYTSGKRVVVTGDLGCGYVGIGPSLRDGAAGILQSYLGRIADQRQAYVPRVSNATAGPCTHGPGVAPAGQFVVDGRALSLHAAQVCVVSNYIGGQQTRAGMLTPAEIGILNADFARHRSRTRPKGPRVTGCFSIRGGGIPTYEIIGTSTWGDQVRLTGTCQLFSYTDRSGQWYWVPSPAVATMLASAVHPTGQVNGRLLGVGAPFYVGLLAGSVTLQGAGGTTELQVGEDGRFSSQLKPGRYQIVGHSPSYGSNKDACHPMHPFVTVTANQTTRVQVFCGEK